MQPNGSSAFQHIAFLASVLVILAVCTAQANTSSGKSVVLCAATIPPTGRL